MVNTRQKGFKAERRAVKELEKEGWLVYRVKGSTKFNKNVDIFGLFDLFCIYHKHTLTIDGPQPPKRKWIQVKVNSRIYGKELKPFKNFKRKYCENHRDSVEIWTWIDRKGWSLKII